MHICQNPPHPHPRRQPSCKTCRAGERKKSLKSKLKCRICFCSMQLNAYLNPPEHEINKTARRRKHMLFVCVLNRGHMLYVCTVCGARRRQMWMFMAWGPSGDGRERPAWWDDWRSGLTLSLQQMQLLQLWLWTNFFLCCTSVSQKSLSASSSQRSSQDSLLAPFTQSYIVMVSVLLMQLFFFLFFLLFSPLAPAWHICVLYIHLH